MKTRILVVEDDPHIALGLGEVLRGEGFEVVACARGDTALDLVRSSRPQLVVLDIMLPRLSGYDVCRRLRAERDPTPVLMLTAKGEELDKVIGLDLGADDYLTKPFGVRELVARIHALLRRSGGRATASGTDEPACFQIGESTIDPRRFELRRGRTVEELTARELRLLQIFHARPGEVLSREHLLNEAWGHGYYGTTRTLDQVIVQIRRKLGEKADHPRHLLTVHGVGYKLADA